MLSPRRILITLVPLSLLALALWFSGVENVFSRLANFPLRASGSILLLFLVNLFVVSFRFWRVLLHFGITLPWQVASRASISGHIAGLFMISLLGQVLGCQAVLRNYGIQSALAAYERVILALVSGLLCALGAIYLLGDQAIAEFMSRISPILAKLGLLGLTVLAWVFYRLVRQGLVSPKTSPTNRSLLPSAR